MINLEIPAIYRRWDAWRMVEHYTRIYGQALCQGDAPRMRYAWRMLIAWREIARGW